MPSLRKEMTRGVRIGLLASAIFIFAEIVAAAGVGLPALTPMRLVASLVLGESALTAAAAGTVVVVGLVVNFALGAAYGLVFGAFLGLSDLDVRTGLGAYALLGLGYGVTLWFFNFQIVARAFYPWFLDTAQFMQLLLHAGLFGLPLGVLWKLGTGEARSREEEVAHHA
jgi:hypothetical protein